MLHVQKTSVSWFHYYDNINTIPKTLFGTPSSSYYIPSHFILFLSCAYAADVQRRIQFMCSPSSSMSLQFLPVFASSLKSYTPNHKLGVVRFAACRCCQG